MDYSVLGTPFLRAYYTLFDEERYRIDLARSRNYLYSSNWPRLLEAILVILVRVLALNLYRKTDEPANDLEPLFRLGEE